jgi:hypothetical protein
MDEPTMNCVRIACVAAIAIMPAIAVAGPREDLIDGMTKCAAVTDNTARLACYDALNPQLKAAQTAPPASPAPASPPPTQTGDNRAWYDPSRIFGTSPSAQTTPQQFGGENLAPPAPPPPKPGEAPPPPRPEALDSITAKVTDYAFNPFGRVVVFLDNGQIWQQLDGDTDRAHFHRTDVNTVEISRGMIGSYNMVVNDMGAALKVRRII